MNNEKDSHRYSDDPELERIFNQGYWCGYSIDPPINVYKEGTREWTAYEDGWEEGWLDS